MVATYYEMAEDLQDLVDLMGEQAELSGKRDQGGLTPDEAEKLRLLELKINQGRYLMEGY